MTLGKRIIGAVIAVMLVSASWGSTGLEVTDSLKMRVFGFGSYEFGEIVKGQYSKSLDNGKLDHYWMQKGLLQIGVEAKNENGLAITLAGEGMLHFPYALPSDGSIAGYIYYTPRTTWYIHQAEASYSLGNQDAPYLKIGAGMFPFKYSLNGRNFGEYLFRMTMYPQYMPTDFDTPYKRLLGLRVSSTLFGSLRQQLLVTSEVYMWPLKDFSLTYLADYNLLGFADIGTGVMGYRMFPVDQSLNRPAESDNPNHFMFSGTKLMLSLTLDFKRILPFKNLWGGNDWRLYSEACLNGLDNYPITDTTNGKYPGYDDPKKRLPILIGFNVPACRLLDVLSVEMEWWDLYPFANSYSGVYLEGNAMAPIPVKYIRNDSHTDPYGGPWHWSVYAKKTVFNHVKLIGQVARDHTVIETSQTGASVGDPQEAMDGKGNWAWMTKIEFGF